MKAKYFDQHPSKLWEDFKNNDKEAFALLYQQHVAELIKYGMRLTGDKDLVKDVIQDTFVYLWQSKENLDSVVSVKGYLITCVRRAIFKKIKEHGYNYSEQKMIIDLEDSPEDQMINAQNETYNSRKILSEVNRLPVRQQEIIFLRFYARLEFSEIAKIMDIQLRSVYKVLYKALNTLKLTLNSNLLH